MARADVKFFRKNTIDLQWKMRANYNARPCTGFRKFAGARTMENNGKNNAQNNGNSRKSGWVLTSGRTPEHAPSEIWRACKYRRLTGIYRESDFHFSLGGERIDLS